MSRPASQNRKHMLQSGSGRVTLASCCSLLNSVYSGLFLFCPLNSLEVWMVHSYRGEWRECRQQGKFLQWYAHSSTLFLASHYPPYRVVRFLHTAAAAAAAAAAL